jgi:uncharacterized repeat protein (TIGR04052 family)
MNHRTTALALAGALLATGSAAAHPGHDETMPVSLQFAAMNGTSPVSCAAALTGLGTGATTAVLSDLRFCISNVRMVRANGTSVPLRLTGGRTFNITARGERTTLVDLEDGTGSCATEGTRATNNRITGTVPEGRYVGARMYMGVPFTMNHTDIIGAPLALDSAAMSWAWQFGRKFAKIEIADPGGATGTWKDKGFLFHLGSTGCTGDPATGGSVKCTRSNRVAIRLGSFNPTTQKIAVDLAALYAGNDVTVNRAGAPGCMSSTLDPECPAVYSSLGLGLDSGRPIKGGIGQTLFKVMSR